MERSNLGPAAVGVGDPGRTVIVQLASDRNSVASALRPLPVRFFEQMPAGPSLRKACGVAAATPLRSKERFPASRLILPLKLGPHPGGACGAYGAEVGGKEAEKQISEMMIGEWTYEGTWGDKKFSGEDFIR